MDQSPPASSQIPLRERPFFRILLVVLGLITVGAAAAYYVAERSPGQPQETAPGTSTSGNQNAAPLNFDTRRGAVPEDTDHDGLPNTEEAQIGTNPAATDGDRDSLTDFDEVKIYRTDPKKTDSDGDGHSDGTEVTQGFNPAGPGKLFDTIPPAETSKP